MLGQILDTLKGASPHPNPLPRAGEGEEQAQEPRPEIPLALYIHIPWCVKKCPYCDFNSHGLRAPMPEAGYVTALLADLDGDLADFRAALAGRAITSVFFGGGTPSLFKPASIKAILEGARTRLPFADDCEITLETNPGTAEHGKFEGYLAAGVNRISFGVQSFDDDKLGTLGRIHSAAEAEAAIKLARDAGYANINLDLMYALPHQSLKGALADIEHAIALTPTHISHYQLTLEPGTPFAKRPPPLPDDDAAWDMQEACQARLAEAGYAQYEVSAYAQAGRRCRHNLNYWRFGDYLGIGAGAHGKLTGNAGRGTEGAPATPLSVHRRWKSRSPIAYLQGAGTPQRIAGEEVVAAAQLPFEFMLNALRLNDGVALDLFRARTGLSAAAIDGPLQEARANGWLTDAAERLGPTPLGRRFLNNLIEAFLPPTQPGHHHA